MHSKIFTPHSPDFEEFVIHETLQLLKTLIEIERGCLKTITGDFRFKRKRFCPHK